uniref:Uncharacterized protein n=1 Tax=Onchocerca volvulus TaxID=6282 RepID=A0A8R1TLZ2_ONCVO
MDEWRRQCGGGGCDDDDTRPEFDSFLLDASTAVTLLHLSSSIMTSCHRSVKKKSLEHDFICKRLNIEQSTSGNDAYLNCRLAALLTPLFQSFVGIRFPTHNNQVVLIFTAYGSRRKSTTKENTIFEKASGKNRVASRTSYTGIPKSYSAKIFGALKLLDPTNITQAQQLMNQFVNVMFQRSAQTQEHDSDENTMNMPMFSRQTGR